MDEWVVGEDIEMENDAVFSNHSGQACVSPHCTSVFTWLILEPTQSHLGTRLPLLPGLRKQEREGLPGGGGQCPGKMGSVWDLALPLLFFCWKAGVAANSAGLSACTSAPLATPTSSETPTFTQRNGPHSEGPSQTTDLAQDVPIDSQTWSTKTASNALSAPSSSSEVITRDTKTTSPGTETGKTHTTPPTSSALGSHTTPPTASALGSHTTPPTSSALGTHTTPPTVSALDSHTTSPTASALDSHTTPPTASALDSHTTLPIVSALGSHTTPPTSSALGTHTTPPTVSALDIHTTPPTVSALDSHTTPPTVSALDSHTTSPTVSALDSHTTPPTVSALDSHTTPPISSALGNHITPPTSSALGSHTTPPISSALNIHTTPPTSSALDSHTTPPTSSALDIHTTPPTSSALDSHTTPSTSSALDSHTTPPTSSALDSHTTPSTVSALDYHTTPPTSSALDIQTTSLAVSTLETQTSFLVAFTIDTQATSPAASSLGTKTTFPTTGALENQTTFPAELTLKTQTISSVTEMRTLAIRLPSDLMVVLPIPTDTSATSGSPRTGMGTVKAGTVSGPIEAILDTLCTHDSSEEAQKITVDLLTWAHTSTETDHLSSESSSSSSDSSAGVLTSSQVLKPNIATPAKDQVALSITHIKLTTCITEIETSVNISGTSDTNNSPTGVTVLSTSGTVTLPQSPEEKSLSPKPTSPPGTLSTTHTSALATTLEDTLPTSHVTERETAVSQTPVSSGTWVTAGTNPLKETSTLSVETQSHTEVLGTTTISRSSGSTMGSTFFDGSSTSDNSPSAVATTKNAPTSETTGHITSSSFLRCSSHVPFDCPDTASTSTKPNVTLVMTSPKTSIKRSTSTPTAAWTSITHDPGEGGGFLLVRLSVASPEDLTEPRATEKLMHQFSCELHTHMPRVRVSLLSVRRG
ncbi:mucin-20 isoform X1 [Sigmodon hispidus]